MSEVSAPFQFSSLPIEIFDCILCFVDNDLRVLVNLRLVCRYFRDRVRVLACPSCNGHHHDSFIILRLLVLLLSLRFQSAWMLGVELFNGRTSSFLKYVHAGITKYSLSGA